MSKQAPPLMRKLLIGQLRDLCVESAVGQTSTRVFSVPVPAGDRLLFSLVWLQGRVMALDPAVPASSAEDATAAAAKAFPIRCLLLDDGTDSVLVQSAAASAKATTRPRLGDYVSVIGELRSRGQTAEGEGEEASCSDALLTACGGPSLRSWQVVACCLMSLTHADKYSLRDGQQKQPSVFAELSWPLEVQDMSRHFSTPA